MTRTRMLFLAVIAALIACFFIFGLDQYLTLDYIKSRQEDLRLALEADFWPFAFGYFLIYIVVAALSLPGAAALTLLGGGLFGLGWGFLMISFASSIGSTLAFLAARFLFREQLLSRYADKLANVNRGIQRDGAYYLFTVRLIPVIPFFVINIVMGLTPMRVGVFYLVSQVGMIPGTLIYINAGTQLAQLESAAGIFSPGILASFALLAIFPYVARYTTDTVNRPSG